jgi:IPT/TIG domain
VIEDMYPKIGPAEGHGVIQFYGSGFREDFQLADIGCKVGEAIGKGKVVDPHTINCTIEEMSLVDEGFSLPATVALNSYSWPETNQTFTSYGVSGIFPNSGPYSGNTDILIVGKGFSEEYAEKAKCRFGISSDYAIVEAEVLSYDKMVCRSPPDFKLPPTADLSLSVPIGVAFTEEDFEPWTESIHRFRYYKTPNILKAEPDEVQVGKLAEILIIADEDSEFFEPAPTSKSALG